MDDDRVCLRVRIALGFLERAALTSLLRVGHGILIGDLALGEPLKANTEPGSVHHDEHGLQALLRLPNQPALRAIIIHDARGIAVDAHFLLERAAAEAVAFA